jgi:hypothetical protein
MNRFSGKKTAGQMTALKSTALKSTVLKAIALLAGATGLLANAHPVQAKMAVGTNLNGVNYYSTEQPFNDVFKMCKPWMTRSVNGSEWDSGKGDEGTNQIPRRSDGYPSYVPFNISGTNHYVHTMIPAFANGTYKFIIGGKGQVRISGPGYNGTLHTINHSTLNINVSGANTGGGEPSYFYFDIRQSDSGDPIRNIQVYRPGTSETSSPFYSEFKNRLWPYTVLRFMDWGHTNNSPLQNTADRTPENYYTQGRTQGVAVEWMIKLCNETGKDMWYCVPHKATDQFLWDVAWLINNRLNSGRKVYLEYSNEVWNTQFDQDDWVNANISGGDNVHQKYGKRAKQVFDIFKSSFSSNGNGGRLVRVLSAQAENRWTMEQALIGAQDTCDAIAMAPYFGKGIQSSDISGGIPSNDTFINNNSWSRLSDVRSWTQTYKSLANSKGKQLLCYEGGQHYVGIWGAENNQTLTDRLLDLNRSWQMRNAYRYTYLPNLNTDGVQLFMHFSYAGSWSKWGSWGSMEWINQPISQNYGDATKTWAIQDWVQNG